MKLTAQAALVTASLLLNAASVPAAVIVPDSVAAPFEDWSRGYYGSTYAEWDVFTEPTGESNYPDVGEVENAAATLQQNGGPAIITGSGSIYSPFGPTAYDVMVPGLGLGAGTTRLVAQIAVLDFGAPVDLSSVQMTPASGGALAPTYTQVGADVDVLEYLFAWDVPGNEASYLVEFGSSIAHMALTRMVVDTYTQTDAFSAFPTNVPEPATAALAVLGVLGGCGVVNRRR